MGLALWLAILAAAAAYQFTRRSDLSLVLFAAFAALSLTVWAGKWQLCWLNPCVWALSDDFSNFRLYRSVAYMRLTWLAALAGVWTLSWLCIRQYGKGLLGSLARSARRVCRPLIALLLLACSGAAYAAQPFFDNSNPDLTASRLFELEYAEESPVPGAPPRYSQTPPLARWRGPSRLSVPEHLRPGVDGLRRGSSGGTTPLPTGEGGGPLPFRAGEKTRMRQEGDPPGGGRGGGGGGGGRRLPKDWNIAGDHPGLPRDQRSLSVPGESEPDALSAQCSARGGQGYPTTVELTVPGSMTVIPFGTSEAEVVETHGNGTATWRYEDDSAGGIVYAGDYIRQDIQGRRRHHPALLWPEASGGDGAGRGGGCGAVRGGLLHRALRPLSFSAGGSLKLIQSRVAGGGYAAGAPACWMRWTSLPPISATAARGRPRRGDDPRAGPPVVGPGQHV